MEQSILPQLMPLIVIQIPYAIFAAAMAKRFYGNPIVWALISIIPLVGFGFMLYILYRIATRVLDRLDEINAKVAF